jgi:ATP-dependent protease ClpP protease subunit
MMTKEMPEVITIGGNDNCFLDNPLAKVHKFYLSGELLGPEEYIGWFEKIRNAPENDIVVIHINCFGGNLFTALQFLRVLGETKATTIASVEGMCMSAATFIFLGAKNQEITNHSMFMFHTYSWGVQGKGGEMYAQIAHSKTWSEKLFYDIYGDFLTDKEITEILDNKDLYMAGEEVGKRLKLRNTNILEKVKKEIGKTKALEANKSTPKKKRVK